MPAQNFPRKNLSGSAHLLKLSGDENNMYYVYVLKSLVDNNFYTGFSDDLIKRVKDHNQGRVESTKNRRPLELIYYEAYKYEKDARKQELFYKTGQGRRILRKRLR